MLSSIICHGYLTDKESCPSWSKEHDWKSCERHKRSEGSNPLLSAIKKQSCLLAALFFITIQLQGIRTRGRTAEAPPVADAARRWGDKTRSITKRASEWDDYVLEGRLNTVKTKHSGGVFAESQQAWYRGPRKVQKTFWGKEEQRSGWELAWTKDFKTRARLSGACDDARGDKNLLLSAIKKQSHRLVALFSFTNRPHNTELVI